MDALDAWVRTGTLEHDAGCITRARPHARRVARRRRGARGHARQATAGGDARRHVDGHDQRLLRAPAARPGRLLGAQGRPGVDDRAGQDRRRRGASTTRSRSCATAASSSTTATTSTSSATRGQLRDYCAVLDLLGEFRADCLGWQYQLGLIRSLPPSDFAEGLLNSACRPETNGRTIATRDRGRPGQPVADGDAEAAPAGARPARVGRVPRRALGRRARRPLRLGAAQLGLGRRVRVQPRSRHAARRALLPPAARRTSRSPAARSRARACRARSRGRARGSTATSS